MSARAHARARSEISNLDGSQLKNFHQTQQTAGQSTIDSEQQSIDWEVRQAGEKAWRQRNTLVDRRKEILKKRKAAEH